MKLLGVRETEKKVENGQPPSESRPDPIVSLSDEELAELAKSNEHALAVLYRRHIDRIARFVASRIGPRHEAEDVTAQIFLSMVRGLPKWKASHVPFIGWLFRLATNAICTWTRRQKFRKWIGLSSEPTIRSHSPRDDVEELQFALQQVPEPYQQTLALHYLEQLSVTTVAQVLGVAEGTVKSRLTRGRGLLKEILQSRQMEFDREDTFEQKQRQNT